MEIRRNGIRERVCARARDWQPCTFARSPYIILPGLALQIRVYDNSARPGDHSYLCTSPHPPSTASLYVKQITGNPVVAVAAVADADSAAAAAVVADRWMPHRQRRRKQRARSKCTLGILNSVTPSPPISYTHIDKRISPLFPPRHPLTVARRTYAVFVFFFLYYFLPIFLFF